MTPEQELKERVKALIKADMGATQVSTPYEPTPASTIYEKQYTKSTGKQPFRTLPPEEQTKELIKSKVKGMITDDLMTQLPKEMQEKLAVPLTTERGTLDEERRLKATPQGESTYDIKRISLGTGPSGGIFTPLLEKERRGETLSALERAGLASYYGIRGTGDVATGGMTKKFREGFVPKEQRVDYSPAHIEGQLMAAAGSLVGLTLGKGLPGATHKALKLLAESTVIPKVLANPKLGKLAKDVIIRSIEGATLGPTIAAGEAAEGLDKLPKNLLHGAILGEVFAASGSIVTKNKALGLLLRNVANRVLGGAAGQYDPATLKNIAKGLSGGGWDATTTQALFDEGLMSFFSMKGTTRQQIMDIVPKLKEYQAREAKAVAADKAMDLTRANKLQAGRAEAKGLADIKVNPDIVKLGEKIAEFEYAKTQPGGQHGVVKLRQEIATLHAKIKSGIREGEAMPEELTAVGKYEKQAGLVKPPPAAKPVAPTETPQPAVQPTAAPAAAPAAAAAPAEPGKAPVIPDLHTAEQYVYGDGKFQKTDGKDVEIVPGTDTFMHKAGTGDRRIWVVIEGKTGLPIGMDQTQEKAMDMARATINQPTFPDLIKDTLARTGMSPRYVQAEGAGVMNFQQRAVAKNLPPEVDQIEKRLLATAKMSGKGTIDSPLVVTSEEFTNTMVEEPVKDLAKLGAEGVKMTGRAGGYQDIVIERPYGRLIRNGRSALWRMQFDPGSSPESLRAPELPLNQPVEAPLEAPGAETMPTPPLPQAPAPEPLGKTVAEQVAEKMAAEPVPTKPRAPGRTAAQKAIDAKMRSPKKGEDRVARLERGQERAEQARALGIPEPRKAKGRPLTPKEIQRQEVEDHLTREIEEAQASVDRELFKMDKGFPVEMATPQDIAEFKAKQEPPVGPKIKTATPGWDGVAYRAETGYANEKTSTAADVIRYEQQVLGNKLGVSDKALSELGNRPATDLVWVTKTKEAAEHYGTPNEYKLPRGSTIIAEDGDGGYLVLKSRAGEPTGPKIKTEATAEEPVKPLSLTSEDMKMGLEERTARENELKGLSLGRIKYVIADAEERGRGGDPVMGAYLRDKAKQELPPPIPENPPPAGAKIPLEKKWARIPGLRVVGVLRRMGPGGEKIADGMMNYVRKRMQWTQSDLFKASHMAKIIEGYTEVGQQAKPSWWKIPAYRRDFRARSEATGKRMRELLERKISPTDEIEARAIDVIRTRINEIGKMAEEMKLTVTGVFGEKKWKNLKDYYPHEWLGLEELWDGEIHRQLKDVIIEKIAKERDSALYNDPATKARAIEDATNFWEDLRTDQKTSKYGHLEMQRIIDDKFVEVLKQRWEAKFPDKPFPLRLNEDVAVLFRYFAGADNRMAWLQEFGKDAFDGKGNVAPEKVLELLKQVSDPQRRLWVKQKFSDLLRGGNFRAWETASHYLQTYQLSKMTFAFVPNSGQWFTNTIPNITSKAGIQALWDAAKFYGAAGPEAKKAARDFFSETGAGRLSADLQQAMSVKKDYSAAVSDVLLKFYGFTPTEFNNRIISSFAGKRYAEHLAEKLQKTGGMGWRSPQYIAELKKLGLSEADVQQLIEGGGLTKISAEKLADASYNMTRITQFMTDSFFLPSTWGKWYIRPFVQFKNFAYNQTSLLYNEPVKQAAHFVKNGLKRGMGELGVEKYKGTEVVGDLTPLLKSAIMLPLAGAFVFHFKKEAYKKLGLTFYQDMIAGKSKPLRFMMYAFNAGGFGIATDILTSIGMGKSGLVNMIGGPSVSDIAEFGDAIVKTWGEIKVGPKWAGHRAKTIAGYWERAAGRTSPMAKIILGAFFNEYQKVNSSTQWSRLARDFYREYKQTYMLKGASVAEELWQGFMSTQGKEYEEATAKMGDPRKLEKPTPKEIKRWWQEMGENPSERVPMAGKKKKGESLGEFYY